MYGDDIVLLESSKPEGKKDACITVLVGTPHSGNEQQQKPGDDARFRNVFYKRSDISRTAANTANINREIKDETIQSLSHNNENLQESPANNGTSNKLSTNLQAIREYAENGITPEQKRTASVKRPTNFHEPSKPETNRFQFGEKTRFQISNGSSDAEKSLVGFHKSRFLLSNAQEHTGQAGETDITRPVREISALHKRFDKMEALLDAALISSNLDYASHPSFQQLVQTGIKPSVIARWFRKIIEDGIDPDNEPEQFISQLSRIIRNALKGSSPGTVEKFILFTGPSGSGKTHLIMKLLLHPDYLSNKQVAVISLQPEARNKQPYYTILEPFCQDHNIPCYTIKNTRDIGLYMKEWTKYDHVLIDSPSISIEKEHSFRQYWNLRQTLVSLTPLEVHYVVNASLNRFYFRDSANVHHPLQPDYIAITHLDEVSQWGPIIPFLEEMGCGARYISVGPAIPDGLTDFSPAWFARQILQDT